MLPRGSSYLDDLVAGLQPLLCCRAARLDGGDKDTAVVAASQADPHGAVLLEADKPRVRPKRIFIYCILNYIFPPGKYYQPHADSSFQHLQVKKSYRYQCVLIILIDLFICTFKKTCPGTAHSTETKADLNFIFLFRKPLANGIKLPTGFISEKIKKICPSIQPNEFEQSAHM